MNYQDLTFKRLVQTDSITLLNVRYVAVTVSTGTATVGDGTSNVVLSQSNSIFEIKADTGNTFSQIIITSSGGSTSVMYY